MAIALQEHPWQQSYRTLLEKKPWQQRYGITLRLETMAIVLLQEHSSDWKPWLLCCYRNIPQTGNHGYCVVTGTFLRLETMAIVLLQEHSSDWKPWLLCCYRNIPQTGNHGYCVVTGTFLRLEIMGTALQNNPQAGKCNNLQTGHYMQQCQNW